MNPRLRNGLKLLLVAAGVVAAQPLFDFLVLPPSDKADQWVRTLIALGVMGAASTFLVIQKSPRKRGD
jgi:hypothetical protein